VANSVKHVAFDPKQVTGLADGRWTGACVRKRRARRAADTPFAELLGIGIGAAFLNKTRVRVYGLYSQRQRRP